MDVRAIAARGAAIGMRIAGNAKETVTLNLGKSTGSYSPTDDAFTPTAGESIEVEALAYDRQEQQGQRSDETTTDTESLLIEAASIPGREITETDTVTRSTGVWQISRVRQPAGGAIWIIDIRR